MSMKARGKSITQFSNFKFYMLILAVDTSADETSVAITEGRRVLVNTIYSQRLEHAKWGGIYPSIAKRAHIEKINPAVEETVQRLSPREIFSENIKKIDYLAVTYGPGLAIALEVGINKMKELAATYNKKLIAVNHLEGHIYSSFVQNKNGNPKRPFKFPYIALIISGGHTEFVLFKDHLKFEVLGETRDDAAGEAIDKAARMLGFGYPGGPVIERLAKQVKNIDRYKFPRPMTQKQSLEFSFSGLKTSLFYQLKELSEQEKLKYIQELASSYQEAVFETIIKKTVYAIQNTKIKNIVVGGGVIANLYLRKLFRSMAKKLNAKIFFPPYSYLTGDNAAMIGVAAYYKAQKKIFVEKIDELDRLPRLHL